MRVLHLIHTPRHSGAEVLVKDLCLLHAQEQVNCAIAAFAPQELAFEPDTIELLQKKIQLYFPERKLEGIARIRHFRNATRAFRPDVIFAHSVLPSLYGRLAVLSLAEKVKFVSVLHSATNDDFHQPILGGAEWLLKSRNDNVIAVSELGAENYRRRFGTSIDVRTIPNGIDLARFAGVDRAVSRSELKLEPGVQIILQVGRIVPVKQQHLTLTAFADRLRDGRTKLWFAGLVEDMDYFNSLSATVDRLGLSDHVSFLGSRADVPRLLAASDLYVMPSLAEAHSIAAIEALASGIAVTLAGIPTLQAYASLPGVSLFDPHDAIGLRNAGESHLSKGVRYSHDLSRFSIERTAREYLELGSGRLGHPLHAV